MVSPCIQIGKLLNRSPFSFSKKRPVVLEENREAMSNSNGKSDHLVASRNRWLKYQGQRVAQEERRKRVCDQGDLCWTEACERLARRIIKFWEDSESTKVSTRDLEEQLLSPNESRANVVRIARQARNERKQKLLQIFRQREGEVLIAGEARWDVQLKGLAELESRRQSFRADVEYLCRRQEVLKYLVVSKKDMQRQHQKTVREKCTRS